MPKIISEELNKILDQEFKILDNGFIRIVDYMGDDSAIVQAARVSYGAGTKKISEDKGLISYLMRHSHCYHPDMEVLTSDGWKKWYNCDKYETFAIPTKDNQILLEKLKVVSFDYDEELYCFHSNRMSFKVTKEHKMYFKGKYSDKFKVVKIEEINQWGNFYSIKNYIKDSEDKSLEFSLIGFYLGDGFMENNTSVGFHLKKERKIHYLTDLLNKLKIEFNIKYNDRGTCNIRFKAPGFIKKYVDIDAKARGKKFLHDYKLMSHSELYGLFDGLINSDGSLKNGRPQIEFSSFSPYLLKTFETVGSLLGYDVHSKSNIRLIAYYSLNRTLEARKQYFYNENYNGKVYCTTSSTGLLLVRGSKHSSAFVCGNTTPFEMCEIKFHVKCPIFVARQWLRHRASSTNEYSARYSIVDNEYYIPETNQIATQSLDNKQGRGEKVDSKLAGEIACVMKSTSEQQYKFYTKMLEKGIARETARGSLTLNYYTEFYWKVNLYNLMHFLKLRADNHAQYEIRVYALQIIEFLKIWVPYTYEAFMNYKMEADNISKKMKDVVRRKIKGENITFETSGLNKREWSEFELNYL